jgi:uncharacterized SAM-binding protein YcdF (DUF218 family)
MKTLIIITIFMVGLIVGLGFYLSPNDLAACGEKPSGISPCQATDAVIAVSGGDTSARTREAITLYKNGWAPKLIFSGAAQDKSGPSNAVAMLLQAKEAGVPTDDIILEEYGETTKQNAENSHSIFKQHEIASVILVTSAYHQRRAGLEFASRSQGVEVRNHPVASDAQWSALWWATPTGWYLAVGEVVKIILFYIGGSR